MVDKPQPYNNNFLFLKNKDKSKQLKHTSPAKRAATEPPPGAEVRAPTLSTNFSTDSRARGPTLMMSIRYSMILSLIRTNGHVCILFPSLKKKKKVKMNSDWVIYTLG
jgi:hypothetical protein